MNAPETLITSNKLFQLWHIDPKGDSGPPCHNGGNWKLHIKHWHFKIPVWIYSFRWNHIEKCASCGQRGSQKNPVNNCDWDGSKHWHSGCPR